MARPKRKIFYSLGGFRGKDSELPDILKDEKLRAMFKNVRTKKQALKKLKYIPTDSFIVRLVTKGEDSYIKNVWKGTKKIEH